MVAGRCMEEMCELGYGLKVSGNLLQDLTALYDAVEATRHRESDDWI